MKCDFDCFNCKYPDCISNAYTAEEAERRQKRAERARKDKTNSQQAAMRRYYQANREHICEQRRAYYYANRETILAKAKMKYAQKKEIANANTGSL